MTSADTVRDIKARAIRMSAMATMVETFDTPQARKLFILDMYEISAISGQAVEMLIEAFNLEAA